MHAWFQEHNFPHEQRIGGGLTPGMIGARCKVKRARWGPLPRMPDANSRSRDVDVDRFLQGPAGEIC
eukprot:1749203-Pyramimonas_sp.AAC.1